MKVARNTQPWKPHPWTWWCHHQPARFSAFSSLVCSFSINVQHFGSSQIWNSKRSFSLSVYKCGIDFFLFYVRKHDKSLVQRLINSTLLKVLEAVCKTVLDRDDSANWWEGLCCPRQQPRAPTSAEKQRSCLSAQLSQTEHWRWGGGGPTIQESACTAGVASSKLAWRERSRQHRKGTSSWTRESFCPLSARRLSIIS